MRIDLDDMNPPVEFPYGEDGASVTLRVCAGDDIRAIEKKRPGKVEYKNGQRFEYVPKDVEERRNEDIWDFCLVSWKGLVNKDEEPIPCTRENKVLLMGKSVVFARFIAESLSKLREDIEAKEEELGKNRRTLLGG